MTAAVKQEGNHSPPPARTAAAPAMVEIERLSKRFLVRDTTSRKAPLKALTALEDISLSVRRGELVMLLGPSGCGKTTLLRIVAGLTSWTEGRVAIDGMPVTGPRRDACIVFQHFALLPWRSVLSNVELPLELDRVQPKERRERARALLEMVGLGAFAGHLPHEISGGMQQRVGIARALIRRPLLLFMDEPFGALDAQTRDQLQDDFLKIWAAVGTTVLFVTHSIDEALVLAERIVVFTPSPGRIEAVIDSPVAGMRMAGAVREHPEYGHCQAELRRMLRGH